MEKAGGAIDIYIHIFLHHYWQIINYDFKLLWLLRAKLCTGQDVTTSLFHSHWTSVIKCDQHTFVQISFLWAISQTLRHWPKFSSLCLVMNSSYELEKMCINKSCHWYSRLFTHHMALFEYLSHTSRTFPLQKENDLISLALPLELQKKK